jgi:Fe-S oxidoreductase
MPAWSAFDPAAFAGDRPPTAALVGECVHCGFCLPSCPTYQLWGEEMDSPRGRIYLVGQALDGEPITPSFVQHIDQCLGCMACVTACPSGVQYDKIVEATRAEIERSDLRRVPVPAAAADVAWPASCLSELPGTPRAAPPGRAGADFADARRDGITHP